MPALPALDSLGFIDDISARNAQRYGDKAAIVLPHGAVALTHAQLEARTGSDVREFAKDEFAFVRRPPRVAHAGATHRAPGHHGLSAQAGAMPRNTA